MAWIISLIVDSAGSTVGMVSWCVDTLHNFDSAALPN